MSKHCTSHLNSPVAYLFYSSISITLHVFVCLVRPVGRRSSTDSMGSMSRERLMAEAGVALIGQRPKPSQLSTM